MNIETEVKLQRVIIIFLLVVAFGNRTMAVWTSPVANPPGGEVAPPLNVSPEFQHKAGSLSIERVNVVSTGLFDRLAVGLGANIPTVSKVEIAGGEHQSGLKFTKLGSGSPTSVVTDKVLSVDSDGRVILAKVRCTP